MQHVYNILIFEPFTYSFTRGYNGKEKKIHIKITRACWKFGLIGKFLLLFYWFFFSIYYSQISRGIRLGAVIRISTCTLIGEHRKPVCKWRLPSWVLAPFLRSQDISLEKGLKHKKNLIFIKISSDIVSKMRRKKTHIFQIISKARSQLSWKSWHFPFNLITVSKKGYN